ncbi:acetate/propionate family kinase [Shinella sp.]|uniref:acetate/propionate family kinase n=1 Tax=Shinella sp. TaxID=1870904 RepID=UPI0029A15061|nr:acetate/propionate family kinase [Shinella sp.]MDX3972525.1 acetate/propionate family kinase [Shinella sp.]
MKQLQLLTFNAGSSTIKIGLFAIEEGRPSRVGKATIDLASLPLTLHLQALSESLVLPLNTKNGDDFDGLIGEVLDGLAQHFELDALTAAGHRIVHGGDVFHGPAALDEVTIGRIETLVELAPLHQPQALRLLHAVRRLKPDLVQTASFDTTFHTTVPDLIRRFALPRDLHDRGIKRYGFHGLSYSHVAGVLAEKAPLVARRKVVIAHLGSGASLCGIDNGQSRDTSMGFSTLDGVPMATRPGWLDPGVVLHLLGPLGKTVEEVEDIFYHRSGLLGVSGTSGNVRHLLADGRAEAREAIDLFTLRIAGEIGRLACTLQGLDAIVFTAGIGENQPEIRRSVCDQLRWLGIMLDPEANDANALRISAPDSRVAVYVIATDEEQVIANECFGLADHSGTQQLARS